MRGITFSSIVLITFTFFSLACTREKAEEGKVLARINDYHLTLAEFQDKLSAELELEDNYKLTRQAKLDFLEECIRKEILIQEARKRELDRKAEFIRAMERYWESTLIRDLLDLEGKDIARRAVVTQEEIEAFYARTNEQMGTPPPPVTEIEAQLRREIKEQKKTEMLEEWMRSLREKARVEIDEDLL